MPSMHRQTTINIKTNIPLPKNHPPTLKPATSYLGLIS
jgi:hypothetical protein